MISKSLFAWLGIDNTNVQDIRLKSYYAETSKTYYTGRYINMAPDSHKLIIIMIYNTAYD